jgi:hypothetical protein
MEILCKQSNGPSFGDYELCAYQEPFNGEGKCASKVKNSGYNIPFEDRKNMLTNTVDGKITISELEVWELIELVRTN